MQNTDGFSSFSPLAAKRVAQVQGVAKVSPIRFFQGEIGKDKVGMTAVDPATARLANQVVFGLFQVNESVFAGRSRAAPMRSRLPDGLMGYGDNQPR